MSVSAPGKLFLAGEYAVLSGGTAVVAAIDRRVVARFVPGAQPSTPLVAEALRAVRGSNHAGVLPFAEGAPQIDSSALSEGGHKLGLGSSAAVAAAAVGVLLEEAGIDLEEERSLALILAMSAHRTAQGGRGSGGDVAVAVFGGVIAYTRGYDANRANVIQPLAPRSPGELVVFRAGAPSATVEHLRAVERLAERDPTTHAARMREIGDAAAAFLRAYEDGEAAALIEAVARSHRALEALGRDADLPIVTPALEAAAVLARQCGGAAKPSGAGGGDVGVAFFSHPEAAQAFRARAPQLDLPILDMNTGARGLSRDGDRKAP